MKIDRHGQAKIIGDKRKNRTSLTFVRYADDFVCLHPEKEVIDRAKAILQEWLIEVGLEISEKKTRVTHTSSGFEFLGFNIRQRIERWCQRRHPSKSAK